MGFESGDDYMWYSLGVADDTIRKTVIHKNDKEHVRNEQA